MKHLTLSLALLVCGVACSQTAKSKADPGDASDPAPSAGSCTSTSTTDVRTALPSGACTPGAGAAPCVFQMTSACDATENGDYDSVNYWQCDCGQDGAWGCVVTGGLLGLYPCDAGLDAHWTGDATLATSTDGGPGQK